MDVNFRVATATDYDGIKGLSKDIYETTDSLLYSLPDWLESARWFLFVGEIDGTKIIAFTAVQLVDDVQGLSIRNSRVDKEYRGRGLYKDLIRYAVQYARERVQSVKYVYRLRTAEVRVPTGFHVIKERGYVGLSMNCDHNFFKSECDVARIGLQSLSWGEFKDLYDTTNAVKDLFFNATMEIGCDIFNLNCPANWKCLEERLGTRIMLTECEDKDGIEEEMISFISLENLFTNEGVPKVAMDVYGLNNDALRCHISRGFSEICNHVGKGRVVLYILMGLDVMTECIQLLKELPGCEIHFVLKVNLLYGDFSCQLEDM